jgi:hypothetical protein
LSVRGERREREVQRISVDIRAAERHGDPGRNEQALGYREE